MWSCLAMCNVHCAMCIYMCIRQSGMMFQSLVRMPCIELQSVTVFVSALVRNRFSTFVSIKVAPIFNIPKWIACALALITTNSPPDYPEFVGIAAGFSCVALCLIFKLDLSNELNHRISDCINKRNRLKVYAYLCGAIFWNNCRNWKNWFKKEHIELLISMPRNENFMKSFSCNLIIISSQQIFQLN